MEKFLQFSLTAILLAGTVAPSAKPTILLTPTAS
jgi:hypothetical protein